MMRRRGRGDGYQHLSNNFQFSIDVHLVPSLLSELSLRSLLFISSTKLRCHLLIRKPIKTHSFAKHFCSDSSIGPYASVFIKQDQEPITCAVRKLRVLVSRRFYRQFYFQNDFEANIEYPLGLTKAASKTYRLTSFHFLYLISNELRLRSGASIFAGKSALKFI